MSDEVKEKKDLLNAILTMVSVPDVKKHSVSEEDELKYIKFLNDVKKGNDAKVKLPLEYAVKPEMFELIKSNAVYVESSIKFILTFTTKKPDVKPYKYSATYNGHEFEYSFLDNHPGIINIDHLRSIPSDYEGLMAVPPTVLEYKNLMNLNLYKVIYTPKHNGRLIYIRVVVSNKIEASKS